MSKPSVIRGQQAFREYVLGLCDDLGYSTVRATYKLSPSGLSNIIHGHCTIGHGTARRFGFKMETEQVFVGLNGKRELKM